MKKLLIFLMGFFATMTFAKDTVEQEALTHVNEFLTYVETNDRFSFEKELYFCNIYEIVKIVLREMVIWKKGIILRREKFLHIYYLLQDQ